MKMHHLAPSVFRFTALTDLNSDDSDFKTKQKDGKKKDKAPPVVATEDLQGVKNVCTKCHVKKATLRYREDLCCQ
jgi:hypothetical protein